MAQVAGGQATYVIPVSRVRECIGHLLARDTHQYFVAYLHLRRLAGQLGRTDRLNPDWSELGRVLEVTGGPAGKPYLRPFWRGSRLAGQEWLNSNLAGSYAASSLRGVPLKVVQTDARGWFSLRERHWELALEHLLFGNPMQLLALAGFLLRDFGVLSDELPGPPEMSRLFWDEYGYGPASDAEVETLYDLSWEGGDGLWFELAEPAEGV